MEIIIYSQFLIGQCLAMSCSDGHLCSCTFLGFWHITTCAHFVIRIVHFARILICEIYVIYVYLTLQKLLL